MNRSLISIIIPTYNRVDLLSETLDSVKAQTYSNWECIVVDDGSTDETSKVMESYLATDNRFQYLHRPAHLPKGANSCRNYGFEMSQGDYIQWFDSDDLMPPEKLSTQLQAIQDSEAPYTYCNFSVFRGTVDNVIIERQNRVKGVDLLSDYVTGVVNVNTPCFFWKRASVSKVSFDTTLHRAQELDFHFRVLSQIKIQGIFIDQNLALIRDHKESITGKTKSGDPDKLLSEIKVRKHIFEYIIKQRYPEEVVSRCFKLYLESLYQASKHIPIFTMRTYLSHLKKYAEGSSFLGWKMKITGLLFVHRMTGRNLRLKKLFFQFPKKKVQAQ